MATLTSTSYYCTLLICLNVILLTVVCYQVLHDRRDRHSSTVFRTVSQPVIRSTEESLYAMYGEGNFSDDNEQLLNYIRSMLSRQSPGGRHLSSRASRKVHFSQLGGSKFVDKLLKRRRNGFFVECGAYRGEELSDTLFFERQRNWSGILIEANPDNHRALLHKNRHALVLRACLSPSRHPALVKFRLSMAGSGVSSLHKKIAPKSERVPETYVQCFTLNSVMSAIGVQHVDFMVLDVEGAELQILETIDWTTLSIDVFSIEYARHDQQGQLGKIRHFFSKTGRYKEVGRLDHQDVIFMRV